MPAVKNKVVMTFSSTIELGEDDCEFLKLLTAYGPQAVAKALTSLSADFQTQHYTAISRLCGTIDEQVSPALHLIHQARRDMAEAQRRRIDHARSERDAKDA